MSLRIINAGSDPDETLSKIREAIEQKIPGAAVELACASPGHFEIRVTSDAFGGLPQVRQHQLVYGAISGLMSGDAPPVHAVDRLECHLP